MGKLKDLWLENEECVLLNEEFDEISDEEYDELLRDIGAK